MALLPKSMNLEHGRTPWLDEGGHIARSSAPL
jgi:hypothetical protein